MNKINFPEYELYDGLGLAELVKKGDLSAEELLDVAIERIELLNPFINAVTHKMYDEARAQLKQSKGNGIFTGVPFLLKDLVSSYANTPTTFGSRWLRNFSRPYHSELVQRYLNAGLIIIGKTNVPEFGLSSLTENKRTGTTLNPWNLSYTAGGSSGGSAAAVAARMVPMAHGSDGLGSLRIPASCCGLFGFKPTRSRTPSGPDVGRLWQGFGVEHALTRSVRDSAALLDISLGDDVGAPLPLARPKGAYFEALETNPGKLKIVLIKKIFFSGEKVHADCINALNSSAKLCMELGHQLDETELSLNSDALLKAFAIMISAETAKMLNSFKSLTGQKQHIGELELSTSILAKLGNCFSAADLSWAIDTFDRTTRELGKLFEKYDVVLTPTLAEPPLRNGAMALHWYENLFLQLLKLLNSPLLLKKCLLDGIEKHFAFSPFAGLFNITGQPAMSVPLYWNRQNLPIGSQFVGRYGDETTLFQLARQLEKVRPWQHRIPKQ